MADTEDDGTGDPLEQLAGLKPAVEKLRRLLQAAAAAEHAALALDPARFLVR
jgi:hypothetical protein